MVPVHPAGAKGRITSLEALPDDDDTVRRWSSKAAPRLTPVRIAIVRLLADRPESTDAETLHQELKRHGESICISSVYRVLREFERDGVVVRAIHKSRIGTKSMYRMVDHELPLTRYSLVCPACGKRCQIGDADLVNHLSITATGEGYHLPREVSINMPCSGCRVS